MKNFKKVLALTLALAVIMSSMTVAFAASANDAKAQTLHELGLFQGTSTTSFVPALEEESNAQQALVLIGRALKWPVDMAAKSDFTDVADWAAPYVAYAVEKGITNGVSATEFGASFDGKRMVTWFLRALGYDMNDSWEKTTELAATAGLTVPTATTRDAVVGVIYEGLSSTPVGGTKTLVETIVGSDAALLKIAQDAGLVAKDLAVVSVSATNLKTITIALNKEINKSTATADTVKVYSGTTKIATTNVVSDDLKTIYVYKTTGNFDQLGSYKVVVNGVELKDVTTEKVTGYENTIVISDVAAPTITDVVVTSPKTIELVFSEPVNFGTTAQVYSTLKIDGINTYVSLVDDAQYYSVGKIGLTLGTALTAGDHVLTLTNGIKDFASFPIKETAFNINVPADTTAPKIVSAEMKTTTSVRVVFSEPVDDATVAAGDFKIDGVTNSVTGVTRIDAKTYDLTVTALGKSALVEVEVSYKEIKDFYGNQDTTTQYFTFVVTDDIVAPTMTYVVTSSNKVEFTFSEDVVGLGNTDLELYDKDSKKLANTFSIVGKTISGVVSKSVYEVTISGASSLSGAHTLKFVDAHGITDGSVRANKFVPASMALVLNDKVAPTISSLVYVDETANDDVVADSDAFDAQLTIYFDEAMDVATLQNASNYIIGSTILSEMSGVTVTPASDAKSVKIVVDATANFEFAGKNIYVLAVKDSAGNVLSTADMNVAKTASAFTALTNVSNIISKIEATSKNTLKVTMVTGVLISSVDPNKVMFAEADQGLIPSLQVSGVSIASDAKTVTLTLNNNLTENKLIDGEDVDTTTEALTVYFAEKALKITTGTENNALAVGSAIAAIDKIAPTVKSIKQDVANTDKIIITYNEPIDMETGFKYDIVVKDVTNDKTLVVDTDYSVAEASDTVVITVTNADVVASKLSVEIINGRFITDELTNDDAAVGNAAGVKAATVVRNNADDADAVMTEKTVPVAVITDADYVKATDKVVITGTGFETSGTFDVSKITLKTNDANDDNTADDPATQVLTGATVVIDSATQITITLTTAQAAVVDTWGDANATTLLDAAALWFLDKAGNSVAGTDLSNALDIQ